MNLLRYSLIIILTVITLSSCQDDQNDPIELLVDKKLSIIKHDGKEKTRFYYEGDQLTELQSDYYTIDTTTNESVLRTNQIFFEYENNKLSKVIRESGEVEIEYVGDDMIIRNFHYQFPEATLTFENYLDLENLRVNHFLTDGYNPQFSPTFDDDSNFLFALDDSNNDLRDAFPGYHYLSQYYDNYTYNNMNNPVKDFDKEVQFYLYQRPFNHCIESIILNTRTIEYNYGFDDEGYPISSQAMSIYPNPQDPSVSDTLVHAFKEYIYQ